MANIVFNVNIPEYERSKDYKAGATRRNLVIINKTGVDFDANIGYNLNLGTLDKGNHSFLFINKPKKDKNNSSKSYGVFFKAGYDFEVLEDADGNNRAVWFNKSVAAREAGILGTFRPGAVIREWTFKRRSGAIYWYFTGEEWKNIEEYEVNPILGLECEIQEIE